ncbi:MAG: FAD-dependent oxidoreductase [Ruminococcaceae bacterium]|nr:FAD-dependent oxidoreductase [Oscillospiraceae bacterium]
MDSVWTKGVQLPDFPSLEGDTKTDVLVVGGGMAGLLIAHKLTRAGIDNLLIEADRICHGVTRNTTAKITSQHGLIYDKLARMFNDDTAKLYYQANQDAIGQFRELAKDVPCDFSEQSSYVYTRHYTVDFEKEMQTLQRLGIPFELKKETQLPFPTDGAIRFRRQAQFHPLLFLQAIAKDLNIRENTRFIAFDGSSVITDSGKIHAKCIVMATHFPIINKHGSYFIKMYQERSYAVALVGAENLQGMYRDADPKGLSFRNCGDYLLLGGGAHRTGKTSDGWKPLENAAAEYYPKFKISYRWATQDCMTLDHLPYIGQYSKRTPRLFVAAGFNKWGMTGSMVAATVLCDLLEGKDAPYGGIFSPSRSILRKQLLINGVSSAVNLLTPTKPRCPHLGCALKWNPQEHSWDCPCHGSRFTNDGKLLDNPANGDLP